MPRKKKGGNSPRGNQGGNPAGAGAAAAGASPQSQGAEASPPVVPPTPPPAETNPAVTPQKPAQKQASSPAQKPDTPSQKQQGQKPSPQVQKPPKSPAEKQDMPPQKPQSEKQAPPQKPLAEKQAPTPQKPLAEKQAPTPQKPQAEKQASTPQKPLAEKQPAQKPAQDKQDAKQEQKKTEQKPEATGQAEGAEGGKTKAQLKAERKAQFEAERKAKLEAEKAAGGEEKKSKAELKAERRAKQEAQRAAKAAEDAKGTPASGDTKENKPKDVKPKEVPEPSKEQAKKKPSGKEKHRVSEHVLLDDPKTRKVLQKKLDKAKIPARTVAQRKIGLFNHLQQYEREVSITRNFTFDADMHLSEELLTLGQRYAEGVICGSNARCIAMLTTLDQLVGIWPILPEIREDKRVEGREHARRKMQDPEWEPEPEDEIVHWYDAPVEKEYGKSMQVFFSRFVSFLDHCRPMSVTMKKAVKYMKTIFSQIPEGTTEMEAKEEISKSISTFIRDKIILPARAIAENMEKKIDENDVIMTYGHSSLVHEVLKYSHQKGKKFKVIVVDGKPKLEGRQMVRKLAKLGIPCTYVLINSAVYLMKQVSLVVVGAHSILRNGAVLSRTGTAQVCMLARRHGIPVKVCCESYKFCDRVQLDAFVWNDLGDPDDLVHTPGREPPLSDWRDVDRLSLLNLAYDITPCHLVSAVVTEMSMLTGSTVPVVLRLRQEKDIQQQYTTATQITRAV